MKHFKKSATLALFLWVVGFLGGCSRSESGVTGDALSWEQASAHVGEHVTIEGPVMNAKYASSSHGKPTFINIGKPYPDPGRLTVVIWGDDRAAFGGAPENDYVGKRIRVTGTIKSYKGTLEIIAKSPQAIEILK